MNFAYIKWLWKFNNGTPPGQGRSAGFMECNLIVNKSLDFD
jgi:hypothetical protein